VTSRPSRRKEHLRQDPQCHVDIVQSRMSVRVLRRKSNKTRPSECKAAVAAGSAHSERNQDPFRRAKTSRENFGFHRGFDRHPAERIVQSEIWRYQFLTRNNERGAFHRPRFRWTVQNGIFSEAGTDPSSSLRSTHQVERTVPLSPARRLGFCKPA
jgi:hypothetical protein